MIRQAMGCMLLAALLAGPTAAAGKNSPKLTQEAKNSAQVTKKNITRMKLKTSILKHTRSAANDLIH